MSAKQRERRRVPRLLVWGAIAAAIALAILYATCGHGFGLGGGGSTGVARGSGSGVAPAPVMDHAIAIDATPPRCQLRVDARGISLDGALTTEDAAIAACKTAGAADVLVTGDAVVGTWDHLHAALDAASVATFVRGAPTPPPDGGV